MSTNITIQEGGNDYQFSVASLQTDLDGGGTCLWVPPGGGNVKRKNITKNGIYVAGDEGYYAYSVVTVNVDRNKGVTGRSTTDGKEHHISVNPETGELEDTVVPESIVVVTPPTYTGPYGNNAYISFEGMVVKAYNADGSVWTSEQYPDGVIPLSQLTLPVVVTKYDPDAPYQPSTANSSLTTGVPKPIPFGSVFTVTYTKAGITNISTKYASEYGKDVITGFKTLPYSVHWIAASKTSGGNPVTYNGKTAYYWDGGWGYDLATEIESLVPDAGNGRVIDSFSNGNIAWTMLYGDITPGGNMAVPVYWNRPGDGFVLESSFYVEVVNLQPGQGDD